MLDNPPPLFAPNGIGASFAIGVSPVGTRPLLNIWQTIISQYANSAALTQLILNLDGYIDPTSLFDAFFDLMWNVDTAQGYGLDVWGRIVGVGRVIPVAATKYFGFAEATVLSADPFNQSPFYSGELLNGNFSLSDDGFRTLIFAKAAANISNGSAASINQILLTLFPGRGNCYCADGLNMTMTYTFEFVLTPVEAAIVAVSGVLPKSSGMTLNIVVN